MKAMINFSDLEMSGGGGDFLKFTPGDTQQVFILAGPALVPNKFNTAVPKPAVAVWNMKEDKVQVMDVKSSILDVLKMLDAEKADWSRMLLKIKRTGSGKEDTTYTCLPTPCSAPLDGYDKKAEEGNAMLAKIASNKSKTSEPLNPDGL